MNNRLTDKQRAHIQRVKELPCSVCDSPGPSDAHHIEQDQQYTVVALCHQCHMPPMGWHGTRTLWRLQKMDELAALNVTIERLMCST